MVGYVKNADRFRSLNGSLGNLLGHNLIHIVRPRTLMGDIILRCQFDEDESLEQSNNKKHLVIEWPSCGPVVAILDPYAAVKKTKRRH